jgi:CubicO group peptidase (beta-lactamase class C family)
VIFRLTTVILLCTACSTPSGNDAATTIEAAPTPDYWPTDGWRTSTPEEQGIDSQQAAELLATIGKRELAIDSLLVIRNGYLVLEANVDPYSAHVRHMIHSCTKSIVSALIGIAVREGHIESTQQPVLSFFPDRQIANRDARKEAMTLENLLTMSSGLDCRDSQQDGLSGLHEMMASEDWFQHVLDLPMAETPGTRFNYCNGVSLLLSAIVQETTGMTAAEYAEARLFTPLGISEVRWPASPNGISIGWSELQMTPRDLARIGFLYLHQGRWQGEQVLSSEWVATSTRPHIVESRKAGYGYQWWIDSPGLLARLGLAGFTPMYKAWGWGGQLVYVVPEKNLVVVFCSWISGRKPVDTGKLLRSGIIPAVVSARPLPANPEALALLKRRQTGLEQPEPRPIPELPEVAQAVSGATYSLQGSRFGFNSFSLTFREVDALFHQTLGESGLECTVGLDGVYRVIESGRAHDLACRGYWSAGDRFDLDWMQIGDSQRYSLTFAFDDTGNQVEVQVRSSFNGEIDRVTGNRQAKE